MPKARPSKVPVVELIERLEQVYGRPRMISRFDPMEELVSCILSQHTSDANSFPAFTRLREHFVDWDAVAHAPAPELADVIRGAGLANQKTKSIQACLREIKQRTGEYSLESLRGMSMQDARQWLMSLPGVGPKTAAIVLCFAFGQPAIPVDTHVYRVSWRLGLIPEKLGEGKAHDELLRLVPPELAFRFHVALIQHGRKVCRAPKPLCPNCGISDLCKWFSERYRSGEKKRRIA